MSLGRILLFAAPLVGAAESARASTVAVIPNPPTLLTLLIFAGSCACLFFCLKVMSLVRGGALSRSWQLFFVGFFILALSQLGVLLHLFGFVALPNWLVPALLIVMSGSFLYGLFETRRVLG